MELSQSQKQTQTLSPQMMQSMKILQMGIQELREYIEEAIQENPVLELPEPGEEIRREEDFTRKLEWLEANDCQNTYYHRQDAEGDENDPLANVGCFLDEEEDLERYILSQFMGTDLEPEVMRGVEFLVSQLDQNGFLDEELPALAEAAGLSQQVIGRALIELQAAEACGRGRPEPHRVPPAADRAPGGGPPGGPHGGGAVSGRAGQGPLRAHQPGAQRT